MNTQYLAMKELEKLNKFFLESYKHDMSILFYKFMTDTLNLEDFEDLCEPKGINILDEYYKCVAMMDLEDDNEDD